VSSLCGQRHGDGQVGMTGRRHVGQLQPASRALGKVRGIEQMLPCSVQLCETGTECLGSETLLRRMERRLTSPHADKHSKGLTPKIMALFKFGV
jgi:hypothetical protein